MYSLKSIHITGAVFTLIAGSLLHFVWEWSGQSNFTAIFSAVSESTWEHLKLLFFPFTLFSVIEYFLYGKNIKCFWSIKVRSVLLGMLTIITVFYTYTGIIGDNYLVLDIGTFIVGVLFSYYYSYRSLCTSSDNCCTFSQVISILTVAILLAIFAFFSFYPPSFGLFLPPVS